MEPTVTISTGGIINLNIDQWKMMSDLWNGLRKVFGANGNRWKLLIIFAVILFFARLKNRHKHKARENKEREKARIWKEEYKG